MVINFWGLYKYDSKHKVSWTNIQAKILKMYEQTRMDGRIDRKDIRIIPSN